MKRSWFFRHSGEGRNPVISKRRAVAFVLILAILLLISALPVKRAFLSGLVLSELLNFDSRGWLGIFTEPPQIKEVSYRGPLGIVNADLYVPQPGRRGSGILLNHGVIDTGKDDPRLKRFAAILCRAGFVVFVPDLKGMRSFHISPSDIDEIQAAFEQLISRGETLPGSCGLFGFSYGAGPTIIAACRPAIREKVRFVVSFGGYYDLKNVLSYIATGAFDFQGKRYWRKPQEYGKWVFLANNLSLVESPGDREVLRRILAVKLRDEEAPIDRFLPQLGEEGRNILHLLSHADPAQTEAFLRKLPPSVQSLIEALSVGRHLKDLRADLILAHGEDDDLIPFTETLRLARMAPDPKKVYLQILKTYSHVDPGQKPLNVKTLFTFYLPEGWKLYRLVYQLMGYR
jgi:pimeloyl-ACP methyl ester carboxylesterase